MFHKYKDFHKWNPGILRLHACSTQGERGGDEDHERAVEDQGQGRELGDARTRREAFFREDQDRQKRHCRDVHYPQGKKNDEEQPVTSQAIDAILQPHAKGTGVPFTPGLEDGILRRAAFRQADAFEGCQLVDPSQHEDATADAGRVHHDPGNLLCQI